MNGPLDSLANQDMNSLREKIGPAGNAIIFQPLLPAPFERIRAQMEAAAPFVERLVAYIVPGLMTSQQVCPGLGVPETEELYRSYRNYLQTKKGKQ